MYVGLFKWISIGPISFVNLITGDFDKTWSPHFLNVFLGWLILIAEPTLSLLILSGWRPRLVWSLAALFMFMLVMGRTILLKSDVIMNWEYLVLLLACAALSGGEAAQGQNQV